jgi:hypothetical protein
VLTNNVVNCFGTLNSDGMLVIRNGDDFTSSTALEQIRFAYNSTVTYMHNLRTRHHASVASNNTIDLLVWQPGQVIGAMGNRRVARFGSARTGFNSSVDVTGSVTMRNGGNAQALFLNPAGADPPMNHFITSTHHRDALESNALNFNIWAPDRSTYGIMFTKSNADDTQDLFALFIITDNREFPDFNSNVTRAHRDGLQRRPVGVQRWQDGQQRCRMGHQRGRHGLQRGPVGV